MEKYVIALSVIVLVVSLGAGYGLSYISYQPQIRSLQDRIWDNHMDIRGLRNQITHLNSTIEAMEKEHGMRSILWELPRIQ